jgi:hypothetical protein
MASERPVERVASAAASWERSLQNVLFELDPPVRAAVEAVEPDDALVVVGEVDVDPELHAARPRPNGTTAIPIHARRPIM